MKSTQAKLFPLKTTQSYGGILRNKAQNRGARPLTNKGSLHLVLRSSLAKGAWSFRHPKISQKLTSFIQTFSKKKGVQILSLANVGNNLHLHLKITNRTLYKAWIRGLTSAIPMMILGRKGLEELKDKNKKFWDYRPFTRIVSSLSAFLKLKDYIEINQLEGSGVPRMQAEVMIHQKRTSLAE